MVPDVSTLQVNMIVGVIHTVVLVITLIYVA